MQELWLPVVGYELFYEVSSLGRVRSIDRITRHGRSRRSKIRKQILSKHGYLRISLYKDREAKIFSVHRLVLEAFVGKCPENFQACHNNGDRTNNHIDNLRWDSQESNCADKRSHGSLPIGERVKTSKLTESQVRLILKDKRSFSKIAADYGVDMTNISCIKRRLTWKHIDAS